jgi:hypothetical protein
VETYSFYNIYRYDLLDLNGGKSCLPRILVRKPLLTGIYQTVLEIKVDRLCKNASLVDGV